MQKGETFASKVDFTAVHQSDAAPVVPNSRLPMRICMQIRTPAYIGTSAKGGVSYFVKNVFAFEFKRFS